MSVVRWMRVTLVILALAGMALFAAACETDGNGDNTGPGNGVPTPEPLDDSTTVVPTAEVRLMVDKDPHLT